MLNSWTINSKPVNGAIVHGVDVTLSAEVVSVHEVGDGVEVTSVGQGASSAVTRNAYIANLYAEGGDVVDTRYSAYLRLKAAYSLVTQTFYNPSTEVTDSASGVLMALPAWVLGVVAEASAELTARAVPAAYLWLRARTSTPQEALRTREVSLAMGALVELLGSQAASQIVQDAMQVGDTTARAVALQVIDAAAGELVQQNTMTIMVEEQLSAEADDNAQTLGHYTATLRDFVGAWVVFKLGAVLAQGWVMNVEGDNPVSEYRGWDFNSFARIGQNYFAANDSGLFRLGGDTDEGEPIDAHLRTMMLDFGTSRIKRVVSAYLGYTSSGSLVLKVKSVDDGVLVENWYTATDQTPDAPADGFTRLGRGVRSRYWQFELANENGADFEIDKLDLYPIMLSRRT